MAIPEDDRVDIGGDLRPNDPSAATENIFDIHAPSKVIAENLLGFNGQEKSLDTYFALKQIFRERKAAPEPFEILKKVVSEYTGLCGAEEQANPLVTSLVWRVIDSDGDLRASRTCIGFKSKCKKQRIEPAAKYEDNKNAVYDFEYDGRMHVVTFDTENGSANIRIVTRDRVSGKFVQDLTAAVQAASVAQGVELSAESKGDGTNIVDLTLYKEGKEHISEGPIYSRKLQKIVAAGLHDLDPTAHTSRTNTIRFN